MAHWTYYHDLSPFLFQIAGNFGLRWYSLAYIMGAFGAYFLARYYILKGHLTIPMESRLDAVTYGALGVMLGGRIGYCLFYGPYLLFDFDSSFPFWGLLKIHEGGMSSHGGMIGLLTALLIFSKVRKVSFFSLMDMSALGASVGFFLGRIANFINGELYGNVIQGRALLGVKFPTELFLWSNYIDKYKEQLSSLKQTFPALETFKKGGRLLQEASSSWEDWLQLAHQDSYYRQKISVLVSRLYEASQSGYEPVRQALEPLLSLRHPSQLYQSFFGGLMTFLLIWLVWLKPRKAGMISLVWAISYLSFRVFTEIFRMPDAFLGYRFLGLTQGQLLSLSFFAAVALYGFFIYRQNPKGFKNLQVK